MTKIVTKINFEKGRHSIGYRQGWELVDVQKIFRERVPAEINGYIRLSGILRLEVRLFNKTAPTAFRLGQCFEDSRVCFRINADFHAMISLTLELV